MKSFWSKRSFKYLQYVWKKNFRFQPMKFCLTLTSAELTTELAMPVKMPELVPATFTSTSTTCSSSLRATFSATWRGISRITFRVTSSRTSTHILSIPEWISTSTAFSRFVTRLIFFLQSTMATNVRKSFFKVLECLMRLKKSRPNITCHFPYRCIQSLHGCCFI